MPVSVPESTVQARFVDTLQTVAALSLALGYPTQASLPYSINGAFSALLAVTVSLDSFSFPKAAPFLKFPRPCAPVTPHTQAPPTSDVFGEEGDYVLWDLFGEEAESSTEAADPSDTAGAKKAAPTFVSMAGFAKQNEQLMKACGIHKDLDTVKRLLAEGSAGVNCLDEVSYSTAQK